MRVILAGLLCGAALAMVPARADAISLRDAVEKALNEHPQVGAARERLTANEYQYDASRAALAPTLDLDADVGKQYVDRPGSLAPENNAQWWARRQATLTARYVIFDGWNRANAIYRDAARIDAATLSVVENAEAIALQVIEAYIDHRRHQFLLGLADENIEQHASILRLTRSRLSGGSGTRSEVDQVEERLAGARAIKAEVLQASLEAEAKFRAAVGTDPGKTHRVEYPPDLPANRKQAVEIALANNSSIAARSAEADAMDFERERVKSDLMPTLAIEGSAQSGHDLNAVPGKNDDFSVKLRLNWRLYDGGVRNAKVGEASALASEAKLKRDLEIRKIVQALETSLGKYHASGERLRAVEAQIASARKVETNYRSEFEAGKRSLLDLLDAQNSVFSSRFESASVAGVRLFAAWYVKALTGTLLSSLGLSAPVDVSERRVDSVGFKAPSLRIEPLR